MTDNKLKCSVEIQISIYEHGMCAHAEGDTGEGEMCDSEYQVRMA